MDAISLQGSVDVVDLPAVLDLLRASAVSGHLRVSGRPAGGSIDVAEGAIVDAAVDGRPDSEELARRSASLLGVEAARRRPVVVAGLVADLARGADSYAFVRDPFVDRCRPVAVPPEAEPGSASAPLADGGGVDGAAWVRRPLLPEGTAAASLDRLGWWVADRCTTATTAADLLDAGGLTRSELAGAVVALLAEGVLEAVAPPEPALEPPPAAAAPIPSWPSGTAATQRSVVADFDDDHPGWAALTRAVLASPASPVVDIEDLRGLRSLDPAARDRWRDRHRSRPVPVPS